MTNRRILVSLLVSFLIIAPSAFAQAQSAAACGPLSGPGQYGPYDFRTDKAKLPIVLGAHFTPEVEALVRGKSSSLGGDIDYTLRAIPNHPNALFSMVRLAEKEKTTQPRGSRYTVDCWFERAIRFRPDDQIVRMIYTTYLTKNNRKPEAMQQLAIVLTTADDNAFIYQNVGILYFDLGEFELSLIQAHKAIELGLNRPVLREKLQSVGKWVEPAAIDGASTAESPAATPSMPSRP